MFEDLLPEGPIAFVIHYSSRYRTKHQKFDGMVLNPWCPKDRNLYHVFCKGNLFKGSNLHLQPMNSLFRSSDSRSSDFRSSDSRSSDFQSSDSRSSDFQQLGIMEGNYRFGFVRNKMMMIYLILRIDFSQTIVDCKL